MTTPEDRLAGALNDRAAAARTSPDALDGVFRKVSSHRRRTRAAAGAGLALAIVAGGVVATAAVRPGADKLQPTDTQPTATVAPTASPEPEASASTSPSPSVPATFPRASAVVLRANREVTVVSTVGGAELATLGTLPGDAVEGSRLAWSRTGRRVYFEREGCRIGVLDAATGSVRDLGRGTAPALSPDETRVAAVTCAVTPGSKTKGIVVTDLATGKTTEYGGNSSEEADKIPGPQEMTWTDDENLAINTVVDTDFDRIGAVALLDVTKHTSLQDADGGMQWNMQHPVANGEELLATSTCCFPDPEQRTVRIVRWNGYADGSEQPKDLLTIDRYLMIDVDDTGQVLLLRTDGLWRWDRKSDPELIVAGAVAVGG